jgi:hypothetical protein
MRTLLITLSICLCIFGFQFSEPQPFISPTGQDLRLSGTFGELRNNHFHTGIDIKSRYGQPGDPILAVADGFISRIRISAVGYGQSIYIDHPNGYTSVYAHLHKFHPKWHKWLRELQVKHHASLLDVRPYPDSLFVQQGDTIGFMGNSGSSLGVHLHFEIRHTKSESPVNPLRWSFPYHQQHAPRAEWLKIYRLDEQLSIIDESTFRLRGPNHHRHPSPKIIHRPAGRYAWSISAFDPFNQWRNKNGLYALESFIDSQPAYSICMDSLPFHLNRYINAHIDFPEYCQTRRHFHSLFKRPGNNSTAIADHQQKGTSLLTDSCQKNIEIELRDIEGRTTSVQFELRGMSKTTETEKPTPSQMMTHPNRKFFFEDENVRFTASQGTFYSQHSIDISSQCVFEEGFFHPRLSINTACHPFHGSAELRFKNLYITESTSKEHICLGRIERGEWIDAGGQWEGNDFVAKVSEEGEYGLFVHIDKPQLRLTRGRLQAGQVMRFTVVQNRKSRFRYRDLHIEAYRGDQYLPFSFDKKYSLLKVPLPEDWTDDDQLTLRVADRFGRYSTYKFPS